MTRKTIIHQFDPEIYSYKLWVAITHDISSIKERFFVGYSQEEFPVLPDRMGATTIMVQQKEMPCYWGTLILFDSKKSCSVDNIAHEAVHAANNFFEHILERDTSGEPFAYLVGWIVRCIEKVKKGKE